MGDEAKETTMESPEHEQRCGRPLRELDDDPFEAIETRLRDVGRRLTGSYPALSPLVLRAWGAYLYLYVRTATALTNVQHAAPIDPFEMRWIDVDRIEWTLPPRPRSKYKYAGRVHGGDWDRGAERFEDTDLYRAFEAHFERGVDWEETAFFERVTEEIDAGRALWGCRTRSEFRARCAELDELYRSIDEHGYMTQAELAASEVHDPIEKGQGSDVVRFIYDEMTVSVARDGELLFNDGRDRLAIAKLLGIEAVPVWIMLRHEEWQRLRDDVATGSIDRESLPAEVQGHPDLVGL